MIRPLACLILAASLPAGAQVPSPYAGQEARDIKALSSQEVADYLAGRGAGLAKAAELNGYPGPAHVLELAAQLKLDADQKAKTEALFEKMHGRAVALGKDLVEEERALDRLFATHAMTPDALERSLARIARLQGRIREAHLEAHLEQVSLLSRQQVAEYARLRGYESAAPGGAHDTGHHH